jgi:hypothetical protein
LPIYHPDKFAPYISSIFSEWSLYEPVAFPSSRAANAFLFDIGCAPMRFDAYCPGCNRETHFSSPAEQAYTVAVAEHRLSNTRELNYFGDGAHAKKFTCGRDATHMAWIVLRRDGLEIEKIGQYPSYADLCELDLADVRDLLEKDEARELKRGLGLFAHGIGAGALIYLRRSLERMVALAEENAMKAGDPASEDPRFAERIKAVAKYLPVFFVENRAIYGVISSGIHEQDEDWCKQAFPVAWSGLQLILQQEASRKKTEKIAKVTSAQITALAAAVKSVK